MNNERKLELISNNRKNKQNYLGGKLNIPTIHPYAVIRPRLLEQLDQCTNYKLIAMSAPAGYGKTTLAAQWLAGRRAQTVWISLDKSDNDSFESIIELMQEINSKSSVKQDYFIVLDNYQVINNDEVHQRFAHLMDYLSHNVHFLVSSRHKLPSQLRNLQSKGYLKEFCAGDICFTKGEIASFFTARNVQLNGSEMDMLKTRTEGWAVGLEAAFVQLDEQKVDSFAGVETIDWNNDFLAAYFQENVIKYLSAATQEFLVKTSLLEDLNGSLCDTIVGRNDSEFLLKELYQEGILLLKANKKGYRYHDLLKVYLLNLLKQKCNSQGRILHKIAGHWYLDDSKFAQAVRHFLEAEDYASAYTIIETRGKDILRQGDTNTLLSFAKHCPEKQMNANPFVNILTAWAYALNYRMSEAEDWLLRVENNSLNKEKGKLSEEEYNQLMGEIALVRVKTNAYDLGKMFYYLEQSSRYLGQGSSIIGQGVMYNNNRRFLLRVKDLYIPGKIEKIKQTINAETEINNLINDLSKGDLAGWITSLKGEIAYELNNLTEAKHLLLQGIRSAEKEKDIGILIPGLLNLVRINLAEDQKNIAFEQLIEAGKKANRLGGLAWISIIEAFKIRLQLEEHERHSAIEWIERNNFTIHDEICLANEYEYITFARVLIALRQNEKAQFLLERLIVQGEEENVYLSVIEILNLLTICYFKQGKEKESFESLKKALNLAIGDGLIRVFLDEGESLLRLIGLLKSRLCRENRDDEKLLAYVDQLLAAGQPALPGRFEGNYAEALTEREKEVIQLLGKGLSNDEIASALHISIPTVKTHLRNIFQKFQVKNRIQAVARLKNIK